MFMPNRSDNRRSQSVLLQISTHLRPAYAPASPGGGMFGDCCEFMSRAAGEQNPDLFRHASNYADPAVICRGPEYLRILYGPEYLLPKNLELLRSRDLGSNRSFVSREFALGIESLEVFVLKEPLRRTHECAFGVLALESEFVDPRL
jgi:hypothetical protein